MTMRLRQPLMLIYLTRILTLPSSSTVIELQEPSPGWAECSSSTSKPSGTMIASTGVPSSSPRLSSGSGATAVTLVPSLAKKAAHVTMLQRSPTYVVSRPGRDPLSEWLHGKLPDTLTYRINRWKNWSLQQLMFNISRRFPAQIKDWMVAQVRAEIGDAAEPHFRPHYDPWTQRVCVVPDGDLFHAINDGRASVVTDEVATFTETGLELKSGDVLDADLIVTATGLHIQFFGGAERVPEGDKA